MPGELRPRQKNYLGEFTTVELALLPVEKVRRWNWVWNITNARPEIYDGANWVPFGLGGGGTVNVWDDGVPVANTPHDTLDFTTGLGAADAGGNRATITNEGVLSLAEQGQAAITGVVTVSEGANMTITRVGQNFEFAAAGGGVSGSGVEKPDDFHYFKFAGTPEQANIPASGLASQRCIARSATYANTYYLFSEVNRVSNVGNNQVILRIEHLTTTPGSKSAMDRMVWDVEIRIPIEWGGLTLNSIGIGDYALVIDDTDTLHIVFEGTIAGEGFTSVFDAYVSIAANGVLQEPDYAQAAAPPAPMRINVNAERVSTTAQATFDCDHPSAAFTSGAGGPIPGPSVFVLWHQDLDPAGEIAANAYDPSAIAGARYQTLPATVNLSTGGSVADYPTIEMGANGAYAVWDQDGAGNVIFASSAGFVINVWTVAAVGFSTTIGGAPDSTDPTSMVVAYCGVNDFIFIAIRNTSGQGEKYLVVIADDYLTTGVGVAYRVSVFDTSNPFDAYDTTLKRRAFFQLGISKRTWGPGDNAPVLFLVHNMREGYVDALSFDFHMTTIVPDFADGFVPADIPIMPSAGSNDAVGANRPLVEPKIHYAYYEYNRDWDGDPGVNYIYYPLIVFGTIELRYQKDDGSITQVFICLWMKDIPEYPYLSDHGIYGC